MAPPKSTPHLPSALKAITSANVYPAEINRGLTNLVVPLGGAEEVEDPCTDTAEDEELEADDLSEEDNEEEEADKSAAGDDEDPDEPAEQPLWQPCETSQYAGKEPQ